MDACGKLEEILQRREASEDGIIGCCWMFIEIIQIMFADNGADLCGSGGYIRWLSSHNQTIHPKLWFMGSILEVRRV